MPSRTTPTPILLALPSNPSTAGMASPGENAGRDRYHWSRAALARPRWAADFGAHRKTTNPRCQVPGRTEPDPKKLPRVARPRQVRPRRRGVPSRPLQGPVLLTARDAEPASTPYIPIHSFTSLPWSSPDISTDFFPSCAALGIFGRGGRMRRASGTPINSPRTKGWGLQSLGDLEAGSRERTSVSVTWSQADQSHAFLRLRRCALGHVTTPVTHVGVLRAPFFVLG